MQVKERPFLGFGLGLRPEHYHDILTTNPNVDWFEILTENYLALGGKPRYYLDQIVERYPVVLHGVSLSIGSVDAIDYAYLKNLKSLSQQIKPKWISDHLCFTGVSNLNMHDLLPLPYTQPTLKHVVERIKTVQDYLGQQILIENVSSYLTYKDSEMTEWEFLNTIANDADCNILLDINNIYVSSFNHNFNPLDYIQGISKDRVYQIHLAGHFNNGTHIIDTHDATIIPDVWDLYKKAINITGMVSTMIERDDNIPALDELVTELDYARQIARNEVQWNSNE
ncbi:MAG TPA: DUF692 domain-containing protein [Aquella sp.]|nr:DUF692 domain-containing protein [Aquella sp.]